MVESGFFEMNYCQWRGIAGNVTDETYKPPFTERKRKNARKWVQETYFYIKNQKKADNFECLEKNRYFRLYQIEITNLIILTSNEKV